MDCFRKWQKGFTLIELLVALLISSITLMALISFFGQQTTSMRVENARRAAQMTARGTLNFIVRELEHLGRDPHSSLFSHDNPALQEANEASLHYRANLSQEWADNDIGDAWEDVTVRYNSSARTIEIVRGGNAVALTDDRENQRSYVPDGGLVFTYFDSSGTGVAPGGDVAARSSIRRINVSVTVRGVPPDGHPELEPTTLWQDVVLRNVAN